MRKLLLNLCTLGLLCAGSASAWADEQSAACLDAGGPSRTVMVPAAVQSYGTMQYARTVDLDPKEVVLTFDDGPDPDVTPSILDTLDEYCVKATFFFTGHRAERYPHLVREAALRGHTIASHSYSHPNNLRRLSWNRATRQITRGISEIQAALDGAPETAEIDVAPFFRFPGLNHSSALRGWLAARNISTFSCDVGTDDWRRISSRAVVYRAVRNIRSKSGGIVIFHDTKQRTAAALPFVLKQIRNEGYRVAHMVPERDMPKEQAETTGRQSLEANVEIPPLEPITDLSLRSAL
ncbi:MAG: polysaccharide deacetylase family protein [Rhodobiaceae bacterium]|nr:polysaccharide deacetylase family protein [Rhodobiaceae bacterium]